MVNTKSNKGLKGNLAFQILIGLLLGILAGLALQGHPEVAASYIQPVGTLFLNLVKMVIIPLVFASIVSGVCSMENASMLGKIGIKTIAFYMVTTTIAVTIGLIIANVMKVGGSADMPITGSVELTEAPSFIETILNIVPVNPFASFTEGNMLQIIVFALFIGIGIISLNHQQDNLLKNFFQDFSLLMQNIVRSIMKLAPFGVFALITPVIAANGPSVLLPLIWLILAIYLGCFLHVAVIYTLSLKFLAKTSPLLFFKTMGEAILFAFTTASSAATIPLSLRATEKLGVPEHVRSFVIPLGATINMDGTAIFQAISAIFIAGLYGIELTLAQQLSIVLTITLASIGTAGVPGAGSIMLGMVLQSVGLPIDGIAVIMGIERILDMARTTVNITGDAVCCLVVKGKNTDAEIPM